MVSIDGLRWQELFTGADSSLMNQQKNFIDPIGIRNHFWRDEVNQRRKTLLPFFWGTLSSRGQIYGNRKYGNCVNLTNRFRFSYPGYNEILTGYADDTRINQNDKTPNPNLTVLEYINDLSAYRDRVAVYASWDGFPYIVNARRSSIWVNAGLAEAWGRRLTEKELMLDKLMNALPNPLHNIRPDAFTFYYGLEYMKRENPRLMFFAFSETDDFAHKGEYGAYLNSAHYTDRFVGELWDFLQSDPFYKDVTTLIITTDHGRGANPGIWKDHGENVEGADEVWMAFLGPDTYARGEIRTPGQFYSNQIARTLAAFFDLEFDGNGKAGSVILDVFK
jgi:hypothetical protein